MSADIPPVDTEAAESGPVFILSSWPKRAGAFLIDYVIYAAIGLLGFVLAGGEEGPLGRITFILALAFVVWNLVRQGRTGQTVGKSVLKIKAVRESDAQILGVGLSIGRGVLHIIDALPCYIGFLWPLGDKKRQTFADKLLNTVVIDL